MKALVITAILHDSRYFPAENTRLILSFVFSSSSRYRLPRKVADRYLQANRDIRKPKNKKQRTKSFKPEI